jgi:hypothetical protein
MYMTVSQNYAGTKRKSYNIIKIQLLSSSDKAKRLILGGCQAFDRSRIEAAVVA